MAARDDAICAAEAFQGSGAYVGVDSIAVGSATGRSHRGLDGPAWESGTRRFFIDADIKFLVGFRHGVVFVRSWRGGEDSMQ